MLAGGGFLTWGKMANLANTMFLLTSVLYLTLGYKTGWAIYANVSHFSPRQQAIYPYAWRINIASMVLSVVSILGLIGSFTYHAVYGVGPETMMIIFPAAVILLALACAFGFMLRKM